MQDVHPVDDSASAQSIFAQGGFDPLFYPARILGECEGGLYIWEPFSRRLKQVLLGNLFPLPLDLPQGGEWISADCHGFVSWSGSSRRLYLHDTTGAVWCQTRLEGTPIASNLPSNEVWVQSIGCLIRKRWQKNLATPQAGKPFALLQRLLEPQTIDLGVEPHVLVLHELSDLLAAVESLSDNLIMSPADEAPNAALPDKLEARMEELNRDLRAISFKLREFMRPSFAEAAMIGAYALVSGEMPPQAQHVSRIWRELADRLSSELVELQQRLDNLIMARTSQPEVPHGLADPLASWKLAIARQEAHLIGIMKELLPCAGISLTDQVSRRGDLHPWAETETLSEHPEGCLLKVPTRRRGVKPSTCLQEIDRISLPVGNNSRPARPYGLAAMQDGHIFATLFNLNAVAHLDDGWQVVEVLDEAPDNGLQLQSPVGIATDAHDRLWIIELAANRARIWNPKRRSFESMHNKSRTPLSLNGPHGISRAPDGAMLIADTGNNRIVRIPAEGDWEATGARSGTMPGEWRHPFGFCLDEASGCVWVVDHRNHRLHRLDAGGEGATIIGGCGFGRGKLLWPESAAFYSDGVVAVAQGRFLRTLKLFSRQGEELDQQALDFMPGCMLVCKGLLLVTEFDGNCIRIFERVL